MSLATDSVSGEVEEIRIATSNRRTLAGRLHIPGGTPRLAVVLHGGVGFPARFYQDFAAWFSSHHKAAILTYDYQDFGWSLEGTAAKSEACLSDWAIADQSAALAFLFSRFSGLPVGVLGHSLGAQWLAFHDGISGVGRVV